MCGTLNNDFKYLTLKLGEHEQADLFIDLPDIMNKRFKLVLTDPERI